MATVAHQWSSPHIAGGRISWGITQSIAALARQHGVSEQQIYRWKTQFLEGGRQALGGAKTPRADQPLLSENEQLKKLLGEKTLEIDILKKLSSL